MSDDQPTPKKKTSGRGCFLYGCLSLVVIVLLGGLIAYLSLRYFINANIQRFTATEPQKFEAATLPDAEMKQLQQRLTDFDRALGQTNSPAQLALTGEELNAVLVTEPAAAKLKDIVRVRLQGDQVRGEISLPLDEASKLWFLGGLAGRHLNANLNLRVTVRNGVLDTQIVSAEVRGVPLPQRVVDEIQRQAPWREWQQSPEVQKLTERLDWLRIEDGQLKLGNKAAQP